MGIHGKAPVPFRPKPSESFKNSLKGGSRDDSSPMDTRGVEKRPAASEPDEQTKTTKRQNKAKKKESAREAAAAAKADEVAREGEDYEEEEEEVEPEAKHDKTDRSIVKAPYHNYGDDEPDDPYEDENNWLWSDAKYKWVYHAPNKGKGKAKKGKGKGKKGKGKSKGKQHGRRRKRRTAPGMVPQHLQSTDSALIYLNQIQTKAIIQLLSQIRTLTSIIITTIIGSVETSPIKEVIEERDDFAGSLQESRTKAKTEGISAEPQGDPKYGYMVGFAEAVVQLDGIDSRHQQTIQEWLDTVHAESDDDKPATIAGACTHFTIHPVANQTDKFRLQIAIPNNALRHALVSCLSHLDSSILKVTSGPAQESFFEEELADWLSVLQI